MARHTRSDLSNQQLMSLAETAEMLDVSVKTLRRRIADGTIHGYRVGRLIRVDLNEVRERLLIEMPSAK
ncbi:helix-turn-helix domain-containing protein [Kocuria carniphila]|uniref:helix-turn-helix domain-containing protein n=1 Tax=Kocuria carniphila TaxID=262208 RepID=UPI0028E2C16A|nr:helix-turn-helix domain-containing protein [Kocuria carniphila]